jgi:glutathione S-transferase
MTKPPQPIRLYRFPLSGHAHRAELMLSLLGLPYEPIDVDLVQGAQKTPDFLARNAFGEVPVIEDGEVTLPDSNAILTYLALRYDENGLWLPRDPVAAARVQR